MVTLLFLVLNSVDSVAVRGFEQGWNMIASPSVVLNRGGI